MTTIVSLASETDLEGFRDAARRLIAAEVPPADVIWSVGQADALFGDALPQAEAAFTISRAVLELIGDVICHNDPARFALLYVLLWRLRHAEPSLLAIASDPLVHRLARMAKSVGRDLHKMTAFVRFRRVEDAQGEHYVAWFEPEHHILGRAADFFTGRFAAMRWTILTPRGSLHWDGQALSTGAGVSRRDAPQDDALEAWWRTYYVATFNPARVNPDAMRAEMPKKYWRNLPEAPLIPDLLAQARSRTGAMVAAAPSEARKVRVVASAPERVPPPGALAEIAREAAACQRCPLFGPATQTVFGEGPADAPVVFVGEQPGDQEDLAGRPFVGPAGQLFDRALAEVGIDRGRVYVTNAVKHFKYEPRGKKRIHAKPNGYEVEQCRWWLDQELARIKPGLTVALGATAARALTGRTMTIARVRGQVMPLRAELPGLITVHPSYLLRLPDEAARAREYAAFVADLRRVAEHIPAIRKAA
jgi:uracil-DNA glycosylase